MSSEQNFLDVKIMGREYRVACTPEERDALMSAVELVDNKMREIAQRTKSTIAERVAVMAALNIAHDRLGDGQHFAALVVSAEFAGKNQFACDIAGFQPARDAYRQVDALFDQIDSPVAEIHIQGNFRIVL